MTHKFYTSTDKSTLDINMIVEFLSKRSYWAKGRSREKIVTSIENSLCFGVYSDNNEQLGFARVLSDFAVFAWIMDVFILEEHRKKGLSKLLMTAIMEHPDLQGLERWGLGTKDAHGLYEQFGFRRLKTPETKMEKTDLPTDF
ncbi:MAG TPA: GNAT family N-acetyltransferase [Chryseosolibacter sp.]|jgi:N-acetylglutamate synthase and related acetyltransferases